VNAGKRPEATFVKYTPSAQMGDNSKKQDRVLKIVQRQADPMEVSPVSYLALFAEN